MTTIKDFVQSIKRGTFGIQLIAVTEPKMNKRNNPLYGAVKKVTYLSNVMLGYDYENVVNNQLKREGKDTDFQAEAPKGKTWDMYPYILKSTSDNEQMYLRTTMGKATKTNVVYLVNDKIATKEDMAIINEFLVKAKKNTNQGTSTEVVVRDFKVENIILLKQGDKEYNRSDMNVNDLRLLFV